jgi:hypothetical protein
MFKNLFEKGLNIALGFAMCLVMVFGAGSAQAATPASVDLVAEGMGKTTLYYMGMPGSIACSSVRLFGENRQSTVATFDVKSHTRIISVETNWGDSWTVNVDNVVVADTGVVLTGLSADFTGPGQASITLPRKLSGDVKVCYESKSSDLNPYSAYGLGTDAIENVVKLPFSDKWVYNHTLDIKNGDEHYPGGFYVTGLAKDATGFTFELYEQTSVSVTIPVDVLFGDDYVVSLTAECANYVCTVALPAGTVASDWPAPHVQYDWDGTGDEPNTTGVDVTATNALP